MIRGISVDAGQPQRRGAVAIRGLGIRARAKQQIDRGLVGSENRPVKRCRAISLRRIHVGMLPHQLLDGHPVSAHHGVGNRRRVRRRSR